MNYLYRAIFAVGGQNETTILDNVERFDKGSNSWSQVAPLPQPLRCLTGLSYRGRLYVFGGESTSEISDAAYRFVAMLEGPDSSKDLTD